MIKIFQSTIERGLYAILLLVFVVSFINTTTSIIANHKLDQQQKNFHSESIENQMIIEKNQAIQTQAIRVYINCIATINPKGDVSQQLQTCFGAAPSVVK